MNDLEKQIKERESENDSLLMEIEDLRKKSEKLIVHTFCSGKYTDSIRQCCIELLSMNVGVRNVEPIVISVLKNLIGVDIDRVPKYSTIIGMLSEMKAIAYQQLSDELVTTEFTTLHSDGTTKFGQHYGSFQISTENSAYALGLMEMSSGSANTTLDCLKHYIRHR